MIGNDLKSSSSTALQLQYYLKLKGQNHNCYKTYGDLKNLIKVRDELSLILGRGENWNDITDRNHFNNDTYDCVNFGKCFSFSQDENVAMWMLYGGIQKSGGMIDFTKKGINSILSIDRVELGYYSDGIFCTEKILERKQFDIYITDILYYKENTSGFYIKRSDESNENIPKEIFNKITISKKAYPWNYENECRLIVSINKKLLSDKCHKVKISLKNLNLGRSLERIYKSPNYAFNDYSDIPKSKLSETIDWNLCGSCKPIQQEENA